MLRSLVGSEMCIRDRHIPEYIDGKHQRKKIKYLHPKLEPILETTYGIPPVSYTHLTLPTIYSV